jgi:hypothetical protein
MDPDLTVHDSLQIDLPACPSDSFLDLVSGSYVSGEANVLWMMINDDTTASKYHLIMYSPEYYSALEVCLGDLRDGKQQTNKKAREKSCSVFFLFLSLDWRDVYINQHGEVVALPQCKSSRNVKTLVHTSYIYTCSTLRSICAFLTVGLVVNSVPRSQA